MVTQTRNERRSDLRAQRLHSAYQNTRWQIIHTFDKARKEHWTHAQLLAYRNEWIFTDAYKALPDWVKYQLTGVWDTCHDLLWRELKVCYPHPETGVLTDYEDLKGRDDLNKLDTNGCRMCFLTDGKLYPFT